MTSEQMKVVVLGLVALFLLVAIMVLLVRGGPSGAGGSAVSATGLWTWLSEKKTYIVGTLLLASDQAYDLGFLSDAAAWKIQKTLFAIAAFTIAAAQNRVQQGQKETQAAAENIAASTDLVLNTMPVGPKNPVPASRTQVTPTHVPPLPPPASPAPGSIL